MKYAGKAVGLPDDAAVNHDHYLYGAVKMKWVLPLDRRLGGRREYHQPTRNSTCAGSTS